MSKIVNSVEEISPLKVGDKIPNVTLSKADGTKVELYSFLNNPMVIIFYRGNWCPYCNSQLAKLENIKDDLKSADFNMIAISPDTTDNVKVSIDKGSLSYTLLSDSDLNAASAFGIAFRVDDETVEKYKGYNIDLISASGRDHQSLPVPSVFLVDRNGVVRFSHIDPDYTVRFSNDELLSAVKSIEDKV